MACFASRAARVSAALRDGPDQFPSPQLGCSPPRPPPPRWPFAHAPGPSQSCARARRARSAFTSRSVAEQWRIPARQTLFVSAVSARVAAHTALAAGCHGGGLGCHLGCRCCCHGCLKLNSCVWGAAFAVSALASGRAQGGGARGSSPASTPPSSAICWPPASAGRKSIE